LKDNHEFVVQAIGQTSAAFEFSSEDLKANEDIKQVFEEKRTAERAAEEAAAAAKKRVEESAAAKKQAKEVANARELPAYQCGVTGDDCGARKSPGQRSLIKVTCAGTCSSRVWGAGTFTSGSPVCRASRFECIDPNKPFFIVAKKGETSYQAGTCNGVNTSSYNRWHHSFTLEDEDPERAAVAKKRAEEAAAAKKQAEEEAAVVKKTTEEAAAAQRAAEEVADASELPTYQYGVTGDDCGAGKSPGQRSLIKVTCTGSCSRTVWGASTFSSDSSVCRAARFQGIDPNKPFVIEAKKGQRSYRAGTRNGVTTAYWDRWDHSFTLDHEDHSCCIC